MFNNRFVLTLVGVVTVFSSSMSMAAISMTPADWKIVQKGILEDDGSAYYVDIYHTYEITAVTLVSGDPDQWLMGYYRGDQWTFNKLPQGDPILTECWNASLGRWVSEQEDSGTKSTVEGNILHTQYTGTGVPINMRVTPYNTQSKAWQKLVASWPASLQLNNVAWPPKVYRVETEQLQDVICRDQDARLYDLPKSVTSVDLINTANIVRTLFPDYYPNNFTSSENRFSLGDGLAYQWDIVTLSSGEKILALTQEDAMEMEEEIEQEPEYYVLQAGQLSEVDLYRKFSYQDQANSTRLTFNAQFSETLRKHFRGL